MSNTMMIIAWVITAITFAAGIISWLRIAYPRKTRKEMKLELVDFEIITKKYPTHLYLIDLRYELYRQGFADQSSWISPSFVYEVMDILKELGIQCADEIMRLEIINVCNR